MNYYDKSKQRMRAYQIAARLLNKKNDDSVMKEYRAIFESKTNDYSSINNRLPPGKERQKKVKVEVVNVSEPTDWYGKIKYDVCRGISTNVLEPDLKDKFWEEFNKRVREEYQIKNIGDFYHDDLESKYIAEFQKGIYRSGGKVSKYNQD